MTVKEQVILTVQSLSEKECRQVSDFLQFLRFRTRLRSIPTVDPDDARRLYAEFEGEDRELAEEGMEDYARGLAQEDAL